MAENDLARKLGIHVGQRIYLVDNRTLTFGGEEYGIRFVVRREQR
jgi:hypothetical protein